MIGIVIVANGNLAHALRESLLHVLETQTDVVAISIDDTCDRKRKLEEISEAVEKAENGAGVAIVTDLFGSSPSNLCFSACASGNRTVLSGANLPMLIKLARSREMGLRVATEEALLAGKRYIQRHQCGGQRNDDCSQS